MPDLCRHGGQQIGQVSLFCNGWLHVLCGPLPDSFIRLAGVVFVIISYLTAESAVGWRSSCPIHNIRCWGSSLSSSTCLGHNHKPQQTPLPHLEL
jgi:hypothetical protein